MSPYNIVYNIAKKHDLFYMCYVVERKWRKGTEVRVPDDAPQAFWDEAAAALTAAGWKFFNKPSEVLIGRTRGLVYINTISFFCSPA